MNNQEMAREAVIKTYSLDGYYNTKMLDSIREGAQDETFAVRVARIAIDMVKDK